MIVLVHVCHLIAPCSRLCALMQDYKVCQDAATQHYDFSLQSPWDVVRLFVPFPPDGAAEKEGWPHQEASNLLNLIEATGESEDIREYATEVRGNVRNKWAHQADMSSALFREGTDHVMKLVGAMPLGDVAGGGLMGAAPSAGQTAKKETGKAEELGRLWEQVRAQAEAL